MYNFRYLLVTIVSIFVSLAIGLLLGAAIAGSDLARDTSQDMIDSLITHFDEINATNADLRRQLDDDNLLATQFVDDWVDKRLDGRVICIITTNSQEDTDRAEDIRSAIDKAGGTTVIVKVIRDSFGLDVAQIRSGLTKLLPTKSTEDYEITIGKALADEWTYSYKNGNSTAADSASGASASAASASAASASAASASASSASTSSASAASASASGNALESTITGNYKLTTFLVAQGVIDISIDYRLLTEREDDKLNSEQIQALRFCSTARLPYMVNGVVDTLVWERIIPASSADASKQSSSHITDAMALAIATEVAAMGKAKALPFPSNLRPISAGDSEAAAQTGSYFALLLQTETKATTLASSARDAGLSALTSLEGQTDNYNIIALLTGSNRGTFGIDAPDGRFAQLPKDMSGKLPFTTR